MGFLSRIAGSKPIRKPPDLGALWAVSDDAKRELADGRRRRPSSKWRCCRCGSGFIVERPEVVPVPIWWYGKATEAISSTNPAVWACPKCGTYSYTVPV